MLAETDGTDAAGAKREYIWLGDMPVAVIDKSVTPNKTYMVRADHLNRPYFMTDATKAQVWKAIYEPFGSVYSATGAAAQNLRFPGQWFQIESGLAYNWHRHYDAALGRYVSADPLGLAAGANVYGYVGHAPLEGVDETGLLDIHRDGSGAARDTHFAAPGPCASPLPRPALKRPRINAQIGLLDTSIDLDRYGSGS